MCETTGKCAAKAHVALRERKKDWSGYEKKASQRGLTGGEGGGTQKKRHKGKEATGWSER